MTLSQYYNYHPVPTSTTSKVPANMHLVIETSSKVLYLVDSNDDTEIYKSTDKGATWTQPNGNFSRSNSVVAMYYDRTNELIYFIEATQYYYKITLSTDVITQHTMIFVGADWYDLVYMDNKLTAWGFDESGGSLYRSGATTTAGGNYAILGTIDALTWDYSFGVVVGNYYYYLFQWSNGNPLLYKQQKPDAGFTHTLAKDCGANLLIPSNFNQKALAYDGSDNILFVLQDTTDSKYYLYTFTISTSTLTKGAEYNIALMRDHSIDPNADPPFNHEKAFHLTEMKIYQIPYNYQGRLNLISAGPVGASNTLKAITSHFLFDDSGNVYEMIDMITYILSANLTHPKQHYPTTKLKYDSKYIQIQSGLFMQFIGPYTSNGSTLTDQVIFEGKAKAPSKGRVQYAEIMNQAIEMKYIEPEGEYTVDTDGLIEDIIDDFHEYITKGILSDGGDLGTVDLKGNKKSERIFNECADHDKYLWYTKPQGALDYNNGTVDSGADIRYDKPTYTDVILQFKAWGISGVNKVIVEGANGPAGVPYKGEWNDIEDQQINDISVLYIRDANLTSDVLCEARAESIGERDLADKTRVRFKFLKASYGVIQVGQTFTLKYVTNHLTIPEAQYIIDEFILDLKSGIGWIEASSGLHFIYEKIEDELPQENSQLIEQNAEEIHTVSGDLSTHAANTNAHIDNLTDIPTRSHTSLTDIGTNTHTQIDSHISSDVIKTAANVRAAINDIFGSDGHADKDIDMDNHQLTDISNAWINSYIYLGNSTEIYEYLSAALVIQDRSSQYTIPAHAQEFIDHPSSLGLLPEREVLPELLRIKNKGGKIDKASIPEDCLDTITGKEGFNLSRGLRYALKAIQELYQKIKNLEEKLQSK